MVFSVFVYNATFRMLLMCFHKLRMELANVHTSTPDKETEKT